MMSMEEYIINELQNEKSKREELERTVRDLENERVKIEDGLRDVEWLVKKGKPRLSGTEYIWVGSFLLSDEEISRAMKVFARLGIQVQDEETECESKEEEPK